MKQGEQNTWNNETPEKRQETFIDVVRAIIFNGEIEECVAALHNTSSPDFDELYQTLEEYDTENDDDSDEG